MPTENRHAGRGQVRDGWEDLGDWDWCICIAMCHTDSKWEPAVLHRALSSGLCDDLAGWDGGWAGWPGGRARCVCVQSLRSPVRLSATPRTVALQAPLSVGFSRREHWVGGHALLQASSRPRGQSCIPRDPALAGGSCTTSGAWEAPGMYLLLADSFRCAAL